MNRPLLVALLILAAAPTGAERSFDRQTDPWFKAGREAVAGSVAQAPVGAPARNVILFLGDGMDTTTVTAARILEGQLRGESGEENWLSFERLPFTALARTYNTNMQVPDSAGTMTAIVSGLKTKAGVLGVSDAVVVGDAGSVATSSVPTLLEEAEGRGLATGVVSTARITHATPAACYAHSPSRDWEVDSKLPEEAAAAGFPDIARQMIEFSKGDGMEVMLGGGRAFFLPAEQDDPEEPGKTGARKDGRNLIALWQKANPGGASVWNAEQFAALDPKKTPRVLGLFAPSHMEFEADRSGDLGGEPSLAEMTAFAIELLGQNERGYFLMVEAGRIDHGHHAGNAHRALTDTIALSDAVRQAQELTDARDTLIVVTADHGHTMSMAGYPKRGNPILGLVSAPDHPLFPGGLATDAAGKPYTTLGYANGPGHLTATNLQPAGAKQFPHMSRGPLETDGAVPARPELDAATVEAPGFLQEAAVPLATETHGGQDVAVWAGGPRASLFHGSHEQSWIYHAMVEALGWYDAKAPAEVP